MGSIPQGWGVNPLRPFGAPPPNSEGVEFGGGRSGYAARLWEARGQLGCGGMSVDPLENLTGFRGSLINRLDLDARTYD
ncbi:MAG: hypothetical protein A2X25_14420 [Chloroflexi bacterium GWB2_49_20]|nr:MAG: hypothetical protein A2X25_14420 [Chloroflexi bacterium GWB2_49_20]OGN77291.1 MAG: hypothetical protein A2X26_08825 [Chloroflexi bacterium GWC2_49_37]OGN84712.1 MAG: hypothetical protein A2X27_15280 [Chloroflexi bacterium GWD2_49_16]HBG75125.1 hypothetical protein [Anaerolineae bacterium]HCC78476.1 hypothetical protein [Anaerolineae bacterium]